MSDRVEGEDEGRKVALNIINVSKKFLHQPVRALGSLDNGAVDQQEEFSFFSLAGSGSRLGKCVDMISENIYNIK